MILIGFSVQINIVMHKWPFSLILSVANEMASECTLILQFKSQSVYFFVQEAVIYDWFGGCWM